MGMNGIMRKGHMSRANLNFLNTDPDTFLLRFVTVGETWIHHFTPESKQQFKQWKHPGTSAKVGKDCYTR